MHTPYLEKTLGIVWCCLVGSRNSVAEPGFDLLGQGWGVCHGCCSSDRPGALLTQHLKNVCMCVWGGGGL